MYDLHGKIKVINHCGLVRRFPLRFLLSPCYLLRMNVRNGDVVSLQDDKPGPGTYLGLTTETRSEPSFSKRGTGSFASKVPIFLLHQSSKLFFHVPSFFTVLANIFASAIATKICVQHRRHFFFTF